jgi:hypothetical protein
MHQEGRTRKQVRTVPRRSPGPSVKDPKLYEELRDDGASKQKAARIANAAAKSSRSKVLMKRAKEIGISGRSSMSKGELVKALRNH